MLYNFVNNIGYLFGGAYEGQDDDDFVLGLGLHGEIHTYGGDDKIIASYWDTKVDTGAGDDQIYAGSGMLQVKDSTGSLDVYGANGASIIYKYDSGDIQLGAASGVSSIFHFGKEGDIHTLGISAAQYINRSGDKGNIFIDGASGNTLVLRGRNQESNSAQTQGSIYVNGASSAVDISSTVHLGHIHFKGGSASNKITRSTSDYGLGNIYFDGFGGGNTISNHKVKGSIYFNGAGANNVIKTDTVQGNIYFKGAGLANNIYHDGEQGHIYFTGAGGENIISRTGHEGNIYFIGAGGANVISHTGHEGHINFEGAGASNHILRQGQLGHIQFSGAGLSNHIEHDTQEGNLYFKGGGGYNRVFRTGQKGRFSFTGVGAYNHLKQDVEYGHMTVDALGGFNFVEHDGRGHYKANLGGGANLSMRRGDGPSHVSLMGGSNNHIHFGNGQSNIRALGGSNFVLKKGHGAVLGMLEGMGNVLQKEGHDPLSVFALGFYNIITHINHKTKRSKTEVFTGGGFNLVSKIGDGQMQSVLLGGANIATHDGDGTTQIWAAGGANLVTKLGNGDFASALLGLGNVMTHIGDGQTLSAMAAAGNIFTKVGDDRAQALMLGAGNIFTHVGHGDSLAAMGGLGNIATKIGDGDLYALMLAQANIVTQVGDGSSMLLMAAQGNLATKVGDGDTDALLMGQANILTHIGHGNDFIVMLGQHNILTQVSVDESTALMLGQNQIYSHIGDGNSIALMGGQNQMMTKVGKGSALASIFGQNNMLNHVGDGMTGALVVGKNNLITKVGDGLMVTVSAAQFNLVTHVGDGPTAALLAAKNNILTKIGAGTTSGILISKTGNIMTHIGDGLTVGFGLGKYNIITKIGQGRFISAVSGEVNTSTHVGHGDHYQFAKGKMNIMTHVGNGMDISVAQGKINTITHVGKGTQYAGLWGDENIVTKVGDGNQALFAKGRMNVVTQVGEGDRYVGLWGEHNIVTHVGDGKQVVIAKGKANVSTLVGDGLHISMTYGEANISTQVGQGTSVHVGQGKLNVHVKSGHGASISALKGDYNATIHAGDGLTVNGQYGKQNILLKVGHGDVYSLSLAGQGNAQERAMFFLDNMKETALGLLGGQAINYAVQGHPKEEMESLVYPSGIALEEKSLNLNSLNDLDVTYTEASLPELHALKDIERLNISADKLDNDALIEDMIHKNTHMNDLLGETVQEQEVLQTYRESFQAAKEQPKDKAEYLRTYFQKMSKQEYNQQGSYVQFHLKKEAFRMKKAVDHFSSSFASFDTFSSKESQTPHKHEQWVQGLADQLQAQYQTQASQSLTKSSQSLIDLDQSKAIDLKSIDGAMEHVRSAQEGKQRATFEHEQALEQAQKREAEGKEKEQEAYLEEQRLHNMKQSTHASIDEISAMGTDDATYDTTNAYLNQKVKSRTTNFKGSGLTQSTHPIERDHNHLTYTQDQNTEDLSDVDASHYTQQLEEQLNSAVVTMNQNVNRLKPRRTVSDAQVLYQQFQPVSAQLEPQTQPLEPSAPQHRSWATPTSIKTSGLDFEGLSDWGLLPDYKLMRCEDFEAGLQALYLHDPQAEEVLKSALQEYYTATLEHGVFHEKPVLALRYLNHMLQGFLLKHSALAEEGVIQTLVEQVARQKQIYLDRLPTAQLDRARLQNISFSELYDMLPDIHSEKRPLILDAYGYFRFETPEQVQDFNSAEITRLRQATVDKLMSLVADEFNTQIAQTTEQKVHFYRLFNYIAGITVNEVYEIQSMIDDLVITQPLQDELRSLNLNPDAQTIEDLCFALKTSYDPITCLYLDEHLPLLGKPSDNTLTLNDVHQLKLLLSRDQAHINRYKKWSDSIYFTHREMTTPESQYLILRELAKAPSEIVDKLFDIEVPIKDLNLQEVGRQKLIIELQKNDGRGYRTPEGEYVGSAGCYDPRSNKIHLALSQDALGQWFLPDDSIVSTVNPVLHEFGHAVDYILGGNLGIIALSQSDTFQASWKEEMREHALLRLPIHSYYTSDVIGSLEMFAESFAKFYGRSTYQGVHDTFWNIAEQATVRHAQEGFEALGHCLSRIKNPSEADQNRPSDLQLEFQSDSGSDSDSEVPTVLHDFDRLEQVYQRFSQGIEAPSSTPATDYMPTVGFYSSFDVSPLEEEKEAILSQLARSFKIATENIFEDFGIQANKVLSKQDCAELAQLYYEATIEQQWNKRHELIKKVNALGYSLVNTDQSEYAFWSGGQRAAFNRIRVNDELDNRFIFDLDVPALNFLHEVNKNFLMWAKYSYNKIDPDKFSLMQRAGHQNIAYWSSFYATMTRGDVYVVAPRLTVGSFFWYAELPVLRAMQKQGTVNDIRFINASRMYLNPETQETLGSELGDIDLGVRLGFYQGQKYQEMQKSIYESEAVQNRIKAGNPVFITNNQFLPTDTFSSNIVENALIQHKLFYAQRKERNTFASIQQDSVLLESWPPRAGQVQKRIQLDHEIHLDDANDIKQLRFIEKFLLASYPDYASIPKSMKMTASEIFDTSDTTKEATLLALKVNGSWVLSHRLDASEMAEAMARFQAFSTADSSAYKVHQQPQFDSLGVLHEMALTMQKDLTPLDKETHKIAVDSTKRFDSAYTQEQRDDMAIQLPQHNLPQHNLPQHNAETTETQVDTHLEFDSAYTQEQLDQMKIKPSAEVSHRASVEHWDKVAVPMNQSESTTRFDSQVIIQLENDPIAARAAARLAGKHQQSSILVQLDQKGQYRVLHGDLANLKGKVRWQAVGHGQKLNLSDQHNTQMSGYKPQELAAALKHFSDEVEEKYQVKAEPNHLSLVGCTLLAQDKQTGFAQELMHALKDQGISTTMSARLTEVGVNQEGRKGTKLNSSDWQVKQKQHKVQLKWSDHGQLETSQERIHNGIAQSDVQLHQVGKTPDHDRVHGHIGSMKDITQPTKTHATVKAQGAKRSSTKTNHQITGNIDVVVGDGEYFSAKYGSYNLALKVGCGGFKSLMVGDNNFAMHLGAGTSEYSLEIADQPFLQGVQAFVGHRNIVVNSGVSQDVILMFDYSIMTPPAVFPFDAACIMAGELSKIAQYGEQGDFISAQDAQWNSAGVQKFVKNFSGLDQSSSVDYTKLTDFEGDMHLSARGIKYDLEATLNKQWNHIVGGDTKSDAGKTRIDKLSEMNETLEANIAVGGQGADIMVTHGRFNLVFGDQVQSILDINLGSLFAVATQGYSLSGQQCNTFTFKPSDLPRQLKNQLLGRLAQVNAQTTLADILDVDYLPTGQIISKTGQSIDAMAMMKELVLIFKAFGAEKLVNTLDTQAFLDGLQKGIAAGEEGVQEFVQSHGLQQKIPEEVASTTENSIEMETEAKAETEAEHQPFGFNSLNLPNLFAALFHKDAQQNMKSKLTHFTENFMQDLVSMKQGTLDFIKNSTYIKGDGDLHASLGDYNFNLSGDGDDLGIYLGDNNNFWGGRGHDAMYATGTSNMFTGGTGNDQAVLMGRENWMFGGAGDDQAVLAGRHNYAYMGDGQDTVLVLGEHGEVHTDAGRDYVVVSGRKNRIITGSEQDYAVIIGHENQIDMEDGDDAVRVFGEKNLVKTGTGDDQLTVLGYHSTLQAGEGSDFIQTGSISKYNQIFAGDGDDTMVLGGYENQFYGQGGSDHFVVTQDAIQVQIMDAQQDDLISFDQLNWKEIWFTQQDNDLYISTLRQPQQQRDQGQFESKGQIVFCNYFSENRARLVLNKNDETGEMNVLQDEGLDQLIQAMSGYDLDAQTEALPFDQLSNIEIEQIASAWKHSEIIQYS